MDNPVLVELSKKVIYICLSESVLYLTEAPQYSKDPAQILVRWALQHKLVVSSQFLRNQSPDLCI
jgi:diketogulonate reductase-like aldo/keto reductase